MFKPGDFSFFDKYQIIFEYDYRIIYQMGEIAWNYLKTYEEYKPSYIMEIINSNIYPNHSKETRRLSLNNLVHIAKYGWENFVEEKLKDLKS